MIEVQKIWSGSDMICFNSFHRTSIGVMIVNWINGMYLMYVIVQL